MSAASCSVCTWRPATHKGRCHTCYMFWRRNGFDRPEELVIQHGQRVLERMQTRGRVA